MTHIEINDRKKTFFITGVTGFLGSHLALELAGQNYPVIALSRTLNGESGVKRFRKVCRLMDADERIVSNIRIIEGDISLPQLGIGREQHHELYDSVTDIINCAADTSFTEKRRENVERINIHGLKNLLETARKIECSCFHQISTAYVSGKVSGICKEELTHPVSFTNVYEESKCRSEHLATDFCKMAGIKLKIYRPGIVCGESKQGRTFRFNGLYYPLKSIQRIIESFKKDLRKNGGGKSLRMGVKMIDGNRLFLPLTIRAAENSGINIIPVDYFVQMFMRILKEQAQGEIFHIVQKENCSVRNLIDFTMRYFNVTGLEITPEENTEGPVNRIFNLYNEAYLPYLKDTRVFLSKNTSHLMKYVPDDRFTYDRFKLCMDYAVATDWGKNGDYP